MHILLLLLLGPCSVSVETANLKVRNSFCVREALVKEKEGEMLTLTSHADSSGLLGCYVLFTHRDTECQSCYGSKDDCENAKEYNLSEKQICPNEKKHPVIHEKYGSTCLLRIQSIGEEDAGFYQFFETSGDRFRACHVSVEVSRENPWKVASISLIMTAVLIVAVVILHRLLTSTTTKELYSKCVDETSFVMLLIKSKLHENSSKTLNL